MDSARIPGSKTTTPIPTSTTAALVPMLDASGSSISKSRLSNASFMSSANSVKTASTVDDKTDVKIIIKEISPNIAKKSPPVISAIERMGDYPKLSKERTYALLKEAEKEQGNISDKDEYGNNALHVACVNNNYFAMLYLFDRWYHQPDVNELNAAGDVPLKILLEGLDDPDPGPYTVDEKADSEFSPKIQQNRKCIRFLLQKGASLKDWNLWKATHPQLEMMNFLSNGNQSVFPSDEKGIRNDLEYEIHPNDYQSYTDYRLKFKKKGKFFTTTLMHLVVCAAEESNYFFVDYYLRIGFQKEHAYSEKILFPVGLLIAELARKKRHDLIVKTVALFDANYPRAFGALIPDRNTIYAYAILGEMHETLALIFDRIELYHSQFRGYRYGYGGSRGLARYDLINTLIAIKERESPYTLGDLYQHMAGIEWFLAKIYGDCLKVFSIADCDFVVPLIGGNLDILCFLHVKLNIGFTIQLIDMMVTHSIEKASVACLDFLFHELRSYSDNKLMNKAIEAGQIPIINYLIVKLKDEDRRSIMIPDNATPAIQQYAKAVRAITSRSEDAKQFIDAIQNPAERKLLLEACQRSDLAQFVLEKMKIKSAADVKAAHLPSVARWASSGNESMVSIPYLSNRRRVKLLMSL